MPLAFGALVVTAALGRMRRKPAPLNKQPSRAPAQTPAAWRAPASIVIPNWNGRDLLEKYLPTVVAACDFSIGDELIVVDNASTDGSADWLSRNYPAIRVLRLPSNLGFGGGSNAGIDAASNRIVVLLNSDMRVQPDFLGPLLRPFTDPDVFAVAAQILFSDPAKRREESGLTYASWKKGQIELGHDVDAAVPGIYPCFYPGGGSSAFDREKLLQLGGFDHLYRPFYFEDTDLGYEAWKRGWKVLYAPESVVYHEHRGTIGKKFSSDYVNRIVAKNRILFHWKHVTHPLRLGAFCLRLLGQAVRSIGSRPQPHQMSATAIVAALRQFPELLQKRYRSAAFSTRNDRLALALHRPDLFHDHLAHRYDESARLQVLFVSPYPVFPPHHGGAVLMSQTLHHLTRDCDVHLVVMLEEESERAAHLAESAGFASMHLMVRPPSPASNRFGLQPKAVREFDSARLRGLVQRLVYEKKIDVLQLEYTNMAQYGHRYERVLTALFEHDVYFQSVGRQLRAGGPAGRMKALLEYLRGLRFELNALDKMDYIQVCTLDNSRYLATFSPHLEHRIDPSLRAGIEVSSYPCVRDGRQPDTLLFIGNFRHTPNREGLQWLIRQVMPKVLQQRPNTRLRVVGPNEHLLGLPTPHPDWLDVRGVVEDVRTHLAECAVFVCPVLAGSGVRVKLLEAFASGIPVVSTAVGAEGLLYATNPVCTTADSAEEFADRILALLSEPELAESVARAARGLVESDWDAEENTRRLVARYRDILREKATKSLLNGTVGESVSEPGFAGR
jgi:GT2 family glycosyltransferase